MSEPELRPALPNIGSVQLSLPPFLAPTMVGRVITSFRTGATYVIGNLIGEGYFGWVYSCNDDWNNDLAAKILKPNSEPETIKGQATKEYQILFTVRHPYITYVYDAFEIDGLCYVITERCYQPLSALFSIENFNGFVWIAAISRCVLQAIHFIHLNGLVHKDIHTGNVFSNFQKDEMLPEKQQIINFKVGDLGIADLAANMVSTQTTLANWMRPPESHDPDQFGPMDHRIDIYHCGLLFLQLLSGREMRFSVEEILSGVPRQLALQLPMPYSVALEKALRRRVQFRTATAQEFWRDLNSPVTGTLG